MSELSLHILLKTRNAHDAVETIRGIRPVLIAGLLMSTSGSRSIAWTLARLGGSRFAIYRAAASDLVPTLATIKSKDGLSGCVILTGIYRCCLEKFSPVIASRLLIFAAGSSLSSVFSV